VIPWPITKPASRQCVETAHVSDLQAVDADAPLRITGQPNPLCWHSHAITGAASTATRATSDRHYAAAPTTPRPQRGGASAHSGATLSPESNSGDNVGQSAKHADRICIKTGLHMAMTQLRIICNSLTASGLIACGIGKRKHMKCLVLG
jgi:hypothetical protein